MWSRLLFPLSLALAACQQDPARVALKLAEQECDFAQRCMPTVFEPRCRECRAHEDCESGACSFREGRCRDALGRLIPGENLQQLCSQSAECGGYACGPRYADKGLCVQERFDGRVSALQRFEAHAQDPEKGCAFAQELAKACIQESARRACADPEVASCTLLFRDCS